MSEGPEHYRFGTLCDGLQAAGIEVMVGMIVGFDHDDISIFDERFRFIQEARIPISMTGMLNALPKTPLSAPQGRGAIDRRLRGGSVRVHQHRAQQHARLDLYEGYRGLLTRRYD